MIRFLAMPAGWMHRAAMGYLTSMAYKSLDHAAIRSFAAGERVYLQYI
jgi:hypothetical protein